jgi:nitrogenase molybdenum-cofactor synthesis protein NifE
MKKLVCRLSTYSADWAGVCSALFELGGILVIHDASGCNSTYATFDEPRWYSGNSMFYISGLTEMDAILGNDNKLINDVVAAVESMKPKFIAIAGSPIPMMTGVDFDGIAKVVERRTGIPTFGFSTNGMNYYSGGAGLAFEAIARRYCSGPARTKVSKVDRAALNIIGATPLDFSINGNIPALKKIFRDRGYDIISTWAMDDDLESISRAGEANVNVVIADSGLAAARFLSETHGTPYVVGLPVGKAAEEELFRLIDDAVASGENKILGMAECSRNISDDGESLIIIGEQVLANSLRFSLKSDYGFNRVDTVCPLLPDNSILSKGDLCTDEEFEIKAIMNNYDVVIADPMYARVLEKGSKAKFVNLPHEAFSGRLYRDRMPVIMGAEADIFLTQNFRRQVL